MARLQGPKAGTGALVIGAVVAALVAAGLYFAFRPAPAEGPMASDNVAVTNGATDANVAVGGGGSSPENSAIPPADATAAPGAELTPLPSATVASTPQTSATVGAQPTTSASVAPTAASMPEMGGGTPVAQATPVASIAPAQGATTTRPAEEANASASGTALPSLTAKPLPTVGATPQPGY